MSSAQVVLALPPTLLIGMLFYLLFWRVPRSTFGECQLQVAPTQELMDGIDSDDAEILLATQAALTADFGGAIQHIKNSQKGIDAVVRTLSAS